MEERIRHYVLQIVDEYHCSRGEGLYPVDIRIKGPQRARKIEITLDTDSGIRISDCAWFSRRLRDLLENDAELLAETGEDFDLLVSSPGLGEPLKLPRQYIRHAGKPLRVTYNDVDGAEKEVFGLLSDVVLQETEKPRITIIPAKSRTGGKRAEKAPVTLGLDQILRAVPEADV